MKWQVFRHVTECNTNKWNTINVSVFQTLGGGRGLRFPVYLLESTIVWRAPALTLYQQVFLSLSSRKSNIENTHLHGFDLNRPSSKGTKLLFYVMKATINQSPHTCTLCPMFSLDPSVVGLVPPCTCWRKETITWLCTSHTCVTRDMKRLVSAKRFQQVLSSESYTCHRDGKNEWTKRESSRRKVWPHVWTQVEDGQSLAGDGTFSKKQVCW